MPPKTPHLPTPEDRPASEGVDHIAPPDPPRAATAFTIACAAPASVDGARAGLYQFRDHPEVAWALRHFSSVRLERVSVVVFQSSTSQPAAGDRASSLSTNFVRYGLVPRNLPLPTDNEHSLSYVPHLITAPWTVVESGATTHAWGPSGTPFPPGLELDFAVIENRFPYIALVVGSTSKLSFHVQLDFLISCSGQKFGAPA